MILITTGTNDSRVTEWKDVAMYSSASESLEKKSTLFPNMFINLGGHTLKIGCIPFKPAFMATNLSFLYGNITCQGVKSDFVNVPSQKLNLKPCYVLPPDMLYGDFNEKTGNVTGLIGMAHRHEIDLIPTPLIVSASRARIIDFARK